jgi:hypothetical protein
LPGARSKENRSLRIESLDMRFHARMKSSTTTAAARAPPALEEREQYLYVTTLFHRKDR